MKPYKWPGWTPLVEACNVAPLEWKESVCTDDDYKHIIREATEKSPFDPLQLRYTMWSRAQAGNAGVVMRVRECALAKVIVFFDIQEGDPTPWEIWGRIFAAMGAPTASRQPKNLKWRVVWFAADSPRLFGPIGTPIGPLHVNGGYAYPCEPSTVIIYRKEEGTRVLLHELLHAGCTDNHAHSTEQKESETETWAEIFLIAILARNSVARAQALWRTQSRWIVRQNARLRLDHGVVGPEQYAWRYTVGREAVFERLGLCIPAGRGGLTSNKSSRSLRFTAPELEPTKK